MNDTNNLSSQDSPQNGHSAAFSDADRAALLARLIEVENAVKANAVNVDAQGKDAKPNQELLDRVKVGELWMIGITILIFLVSAFQAFETWANNDSTGKQVNHIITAADRINDAADRFAKSSADTSREIQDAVAKLNLQANETVLLRESAQSSAQTASSSLNEYKRNEKSLISVRNVEVVTGEPIINGKPSFLFFLNLENSGSTSTKHMIINMAGGSHGEFGNPIDFPKAMKLKASIPAVMGPHSNMRLFTREAMSEAAYRDSSLIFGRITYGDVFGMEHITEYCWELIGSTEHPAMQPCTYPGDASHNCQDEDCKVR